MKKNKSKIIKKIFSKLIYCAEFILSIILISFCIAIFIDKKYYEFYPLSKIIIVGICGILLIFIMVYICRNNRKNIENLFLCFAIPLSISYALFILPLNVPDEGSHILKAYDITCGNIFTNIDENGESYNWIVKDLKNYSYTRFKDYRDVSNEIIKATDYNENVKAVSPAQAYSPILYLGTALGLEIAKTLNLNIIIGIYIARLINCMIFLIFGFLSIRKIPFGKLALSVCLCAPMMLQQAASCSCDAVLNAVVIYYISYLLYIVFKDGIITKKDKAVIYIFTAFVAMFKYIYILVAGLLFIPIFRKKKNASENLKILLATILIGSVFLVGWLSFSLRYKTMSPETIAYNKELNVNQSEQISFIKQSSFAFAKTFVREYILYGPDYIMESIGTKLGWINVSVSPGLIAFYLVLMILATISENSKYQFERKEKLWIIILLFAISALLSIAMYISFTPVGLNKICGIQGRYYTPILILILLCFVTKENYLKIKNVNIKMLLIAMILNFIVLYTVLVSYL